MTLFERVLLPSFAGATEWLDSEPLGAAESGDRGFYRRELSLFVGAYVVYHAARWLFTGDLSQAQWHAESIMRLERELGLAVEASVQHRLDTGLWSPFFSYVYMAAQLVVLPGSLVWLYRRAPGVYRPLRNTVLGTWLIAIPIYALFPVAPPRLAHAGIVDAVSEQAGFALTITRWTIGRTRSLPGHLPPSRTATHRR